MFCKTIPTAMRDCSNPEAVYTRGDHELLFKENLKYIHSFYVCFVYVCSFFLHFMFKSFDLIVDAGHIEANGKTPFDFNKVVASPI